jgi:Protein of unknown function (DUF4230)
MPTDLDRHAPAPHAGNQEVTVRVVADGAPRRRRGAVASVVSTLVVGAVAVAVIVAAGVVTGFLDIGNPFATSTVDRTGPALLRELNDLSQYTAARGKFQSTVDIEDDVGLLPSFIAGERTVYQAQGSVDASVDFSALAKDAISEAADGSVTVTLPEPRLQRAVIDERESRVVSRNRGLVNRVADAFSDNPHTERGVVLEAQQKIHRAAEHSSLVRRAERNTTAMLQGLLGKLGYTDVRVVYARPATTT